MIIVTEHKAEYSADAAGMQVVPGAEQYKVGGGVTRERLRSPLIEGGETALDNGYIIVPVAPFSKRPSLMTPRGEVKSMREWDAMTRAKAEGAIRYWQSWGPGWGFGILAGVSSTEFGGILPVDIDVLDRDLSNYLRDMTFDMLGPTGFVRVGKSPKQMPLYRMTRCFKKIKIGSVELLGVGNQFIAAGYHPDTRALYQYTGFEGALYDTHVSDVPLVEHEQFLEFIRAISVAQHGEGARQVADDLRKTIRALHASGVSPESIAAVEDLYGVSLDSKKSSHYLNAPPPELSRLAELLEWIPNDRPEDWDFYGQTIMGAIHTATGGSEDGLQVFSAWSAKNAKHDASEDRDRWEHLKRSPLTQIRVGTLYHWAKEFGWQRPMHERIDMTTDVGNPVVDVTGKVVVDLPEEVEISEAQRRTMTKAQHARDFIKSTEVIQWRAAHRAWLHLCDEEREHRRAADYLRRLKAGAVAAYNDLPNTPEEATRSALKLENGNTDFAKLRKMTEKLAAMQDNGGFDLSAGLLSLEQAVLAYPVVYKAAPPNKKDKMTSAEDWLLLVEMRKELANRGLRAALLQAKIEGVEIEDPRENPLPMLWPVGGVAVVFREPPSSGKSYAINHAILADKDIRALVVTSDHGGGGTKRLAEELQHLGDDFVILRGMTAENPDADPLPNGTQPKMCAFAHMIPAVKAAGGAASSMCGKPGTRHVCPKYDTCAFVKQPLSRRVTVVAGADAVQFFPDAAKKADVLIYDDVAASRMQVVDDVDTSTIEAFKKMTPPEGSYQLSNLAMDRCARFAQDFGALISEALQGNGRLSPALIERVMPGWVARGVIDEIAAKDWPPEEDLPGMLAQGWTPYLYCDCLELIKVEADLRRMVVPLHLLITPGGNPLSKVDPAIARWNAACIGLADAADTLISTMTNVRRVARVVRGEDKAILRTTRNVELPNALDSTPVLALDGTAEDWLVEATLGGRRMGLPPTVEELLGAELGHSVETVRWREPFRIRPFDGVVVRKLAGTEMTLGKLAPPNRAHYGADETTEDGRVGNASFEKAVVTTANNREVLHNLSLRMRLFHGVSGTGLTAPKGVEPLLREIEDTLVARYGAGAGVLAQPVLWRQEYKARGDNSLSGVSGYISVSRLGSQPAHYEDSACVAFGVWLEFNDRHELAPAYYPLRDGRVFEGSVAINSDPYGEAYRRDLVRGSVGQGGALRVRPGSASGRAVLEAWELQAEPSGLYAYDSLVTMADIRDMANDVVRAAGCGLLPVSHAAEVLAGPAGVSVVTMDNRLRLVDLQERKDLDALLDMRREGSLPWVVSSLWMVPVAGLQQPAVVALSVQEGDVLAATRLLDAHRVAISGVPVPADEAAAVLGGGTETPKASLTGYWRSETPYRESLYGESDLDYPVKGIEPPSASQYAPPAGAWGECVALLTGTLFEMPARAGVFARPGERGFNTLAAHLANVTPGAVKKALENEHLRYALESILPEEVNLTNAVVTIKPKGALRAVNLEVMLIHPASKAYLEAKGVSVVMTGPFACEADQGDGDPKALN